MGWKQEGGEGGLITLIEGIWPGTLYSLLAFRDLMFVVSFLETGRRWPKLFVCWFVSIYLTLCFPQTCILTHHVRCPEGLAGSLY